jgi:hypothetical protein
MIEVVILLIDKSLHSTKQNREETENSVQYYTIRARAI